MKVVAFKITEAAFASQGAAAHRAYGGGGPRCMEGRQMQAETWKRLLLPGGPAHAGRGTDAVLCSASAGSDGGSVLTVQCWRRSQRGGAQRDGGYKARGGEEGTELTAWPLPQDGDGGGEVRSLHVRRARGSTRGVGAGGLLPVPTLHPHPSRSAWTKLWLLPPSGLQPSTLPLQICLDKAGF